MAEKTFLNMHLLDAVERGNLQAAAALIKAGANPAAYDHTAEPLVHVAYEHSGPAMAEMIKLLVENGADVYATTGSSRSIFDIMAEVSDYYNMMLIHNIGIIPKSSCERQLINWFGYQDVKMALDAGVNAADISVESACSDLDYRSVRLLIKNGADVNKRNRDGNTPLMRVVSDQYKKFLYRRFEFNMLKGRSEKDKYIKSIRLGRIRIIMTLLRHGADMSVKNYDDKTVYDLTKDMEIIKILNKHTKGQLVLAV
ncbi:MAG TPA: ankyrin repeat domain-containing protein [Candidatus Goldiibacteriota bacterium]|nr:ankyrin repeat domain-containing protein [Candidatus Goldiibacteriota bacterium]